MRQWVEAELGFINKSHAKSMRRRNWNATEYWILESEHVSKFYHTADVIKVKINMIMMLAVMILMVITNYVWIWNQIYPECSRFLYHHYHHHMANDVDSVETSNMLTAFMVLVLTVETRNTIGDECDRGLAYPHTKELEMLKQDLLFEMFLWV